MQPMSQQELMEAYQRSLEIDRQIEKDRKVFEQRSRDPKVLILGSGDSGKTTLLKQMQILHGGGFSEKEVFRFMKLLHQSMVVNMQRLLKVSVGMKPENEAQQYLIANLSDWNLDDIHAQVMQALWDDPAVRSAFEDPKHEFHPSLAAFFPRAREIFRRDFKMTNQDILILRVPTEIVSETIFHIDNKRFRFYDVGGQRGLRKQWVPFFDDVNAVLFITSLVCYDEFLPVNEDQFQCNRMVDAALLFQDIADNTLLAKANLVLFLNKADLLAERLKRSRVKDYFPNYTGMNTESAAVKFFHRQFAKSVKESDLRTFSVHKTCCTDTKSMDVLITSVIGNITSRHLESFGMV